MGKHTNKITSAGLLVALGIIYGDIGTSPLYVFNAIILNKLITEELIIGALSCIIWTITLQTTFKYVFLILKADNKGEGGAFALYALVRRRKKWLVIPAMIGGAALLADGIITPPISITAAIEGIKKLPALQDITQDTVVIIVIGIMALFFFMQQFGTASIGKLFGPIMLVWFSMLAIVGSVHILDDLSVFKAFNPYYAIKLLVLYPKGFWILGAVFLCTTGGEALYSDLGHCGKKNIRATWGFVKISLLLNYIGQASYLLAHHKNLFLDAHTKAALNINPFYDVMPEWFILTGVIIATCAAIIASQAMISGSFTLISEALRLNLWPKLKIRYPSEEKGQLFIPTINFLMFLGCTGVVLYFRESARMEAAYGLAIIITMLATTILYANFMVLHRTKAIIIYSFLAIYLIIELAFLIALLEKFPHGGYITMIIGGLMFIIMYAWYRSKKIKNRYTEFVRLAPYIPQIKQLSNDKSITKYATHLVYMTSSNISKEIEHKIIYSILSKNPKRADIYWFVHVNVLDEPNTCEYVVDHIVPNDLVRIDFNLGFRVEQKINLMFKKVIEDLVANKEVVFPHHYNSFDKSDIIGDFQFIVLEKFLSQDNELPFFERVVMKIYFWLKEVSLSEEKGFGLDASNVVVEKFPLIVAPIQHFKLKRTYESQ